MKYLMLMQINPTVLEQLSQEQQQSLQAGHRAFTTLTKESGELLSTKALADPSQSKVIRAKDGIPDVSDGPFVEAKEFMGGYYLIDVEDEARAIELAKLIPDTSIPGLAVEIRPVMYFDGADM